MTLYKAIIFWRPFIQIKSMILKSVKGTQQTADSRIEDWYKFDQT